MSDPVDDVTAATAGISLDKHPRTNPSSAEVVSLLSNISPEVYARIEAFQNKRNPKSRSSVPRKSSDNENTDKSSVDSSNTNGISSDQITKSAPPFQHAHIDYKATIPDYSKLHSSMPMYKQQGSSPSSNTPSLSARRGLKLNGADMLSSSPLSLPPTPGIPSLSGSSTASASSPALPSTTSNPSSRKPGFKLDIGAINSTDASRAASAQLVSNANTSIANSNNNPPISSSSQASFSRKPNPRGLPGDLSLDISSKPENVFSGHSKYIDINSGHLNFAGKASLHSKGIDFSSGSKFRISLDELEPLGELGRGNYGTVTKVRHKPTDIIMAMKEIRLELEEAKFLQIIMELEVLHKCHSPYIVDFYGAFFVEGAVYLCMEYMDGGSLDKIYDGGVDEPYLAVITDSVVRGLKQLKDEHNIIHRDVKPTNILVSTSGKVKLCDFGVSGNLVASIAKTNIGCQSYMAPERIKVANPDDVLTYNVQSDIWSLGLSVLEVAKGCYPYPPDTYRNLFSQLSAIIYGDTPALPADRFSPEARSFVANCLNKSPTLRPTYAKLLNHPWLKKYAKQEEKDKVKLGDFIKLALERNAQKEKDKKGHHDTNSHNVNTEKESADTNTLKPSAQKEPVLESCSSSTTPTNNIASPNTLTQKTTSP